MAHTDIERDAGVNSEVNFYQLLGIEPTSVQQDIREAYIRAKDSFKNSSDAFYSLTGEGEMRRYQELIETAFHTLSDEKNKKIYDQRMNIALGTEDEEDSKASIPQYKPIVKKVIDAQVLSEYKGVIDDDAYKLGEKLAKIRELSGHSLEDVWKHTKISLQYLEYFETNKFEKLPAIVYSKGLLRAYCDFLNIPTQDSYIQSYIEELKSHQQAA